MYRVSAINAGGGAAAAGLAYTGVPITFMLSVGVSVLCLGLLILLAARRGTAQVPDATTSVPTADPTSTDPTGTDSPTADDHRHPDPGLPR